MSLFSNYLDKGRLNRVTIQALNFNPRKKRLTLPLAQSCREEGNDCCLPATSLSGHHSGKKSLNKKNKKKNNNKKRLLHRFDEF